MVLPTPIETINELNKLLFNFLWDEKPDKLEDRSQKKKIMFLHSKNKESRKGYKGEC